MAGRKQKTLVLLAWFAFIQGGAHKGRDDMRTLLDKIAKAYSYPADDEFRENFLQLHRVLAGLLSAEKCFFSRECLEAENEARLKLFEQKCNMLSARNEGYKLLREKKLKEVGLVEVAPAVMRYQLNDKFYDLRYDFAKMIMSGPREVDARENLESALSEYKIAASKLGIEEKLLSCDLYGKALGRFKEKRGLPPRPVINAGGTEFESFFSWQEKFEHFYVLAITEWFIKLFWHGMNSERHPAADGLSKVKGKAVLLLKAIEEERAELEEVAGDDHGLENLVNTLQCLADTGVVNQYSFLYDRERVKRGAVRELSSLKTDPVRGAYYLALSRAWQKALPFFSPKSRPFADVLLYLIQIRYDHEVERQVNSFLCDNL